LENSFDRTASWRPFRCMMFLNCECPAMGNFPYAEHRLVLTGGGRTVGL
jgi:hypothetical protein